MKIEAILLLTTIAFMMGLVFTVTRFISSARYGLWASFIKGYFRGNENRREWVKEYNIYYWSLLFNISLIATILTLCGAVGQLEFLNRPFLALVVSPILWYSLLRCMMYYVKSLKLHS